MKKLTAGAKFLIATTSVVAASGAVIGGIKLYGEHNELGVYHLQLEQSDSNAVTNLTKVSSADFLDSVGQVVAKFDSNLDPNNPQNENSMVILQQRVNGKMTMSVKDFRLWFLKTYNRQTPIFRVKIGLMTFINEYFEALSPQEFVDYAKWFIKNVSWGPETLSLSSFTLKKGVIVNGNAITLGQHQGKRKEETNITFYPDAFFGSLPLASNYAGRGNGPDSLTYQFNSLAFTKEQLQEYIKTIPQRLVISNYPDKFTAGGVVGLDLLLGKKIHRYSLYNALKATLEKAKQNATQQSQQQTIKAQQPVFENGLNDPDLVSIKNTRADGSVEVITPTKKATGLNKDISFNVDYDAELKKLEALKLKPEDTYFYAFSDKDEPSAKHQQLVAKFTTALYIFAKNHNISLANNPEVVLDTTQVDKEYTIEKLINKHRDANWEQYRLYPDDVPEQYLETVDFVISNPDFDTKKERDSQNQKQLKFSYNFRINRLANGTNKDELNSLMLLEFIKETQPQLEKLATNGFRNFYNFQSTKGNTIYLYEDGKKTTFHQSLEYAEDNYGEDFDFKKLKKVSILDVVKKDKDHLEIKLTDEDKYKTYLEQFAKDTTFSTKLTPVLKTFTDLQKTPNSKLPNLLNALSFDAKTQTLSITDPSLVSFLQKHLTKLKEFYTKHNLTNSQNIDALLLQLEKLWNKQLDEAELNNTYLDSTDDGVTSVTEQTLETNISSFASFVDAALNLVNTLNAKPEAKAKSDAEFTIVKEINLASNNPDLKQAEEEFRTFKWSVNYFDRVTPRIIKENDEIIDLKPTKTYTLFLDYYDGLIDTVLENDPYVATEIDGTHLEKSINPTTGEITYSIADGKYTGFYSTDRISFISLLKASSDKFKTTGINYLRYVGQHEYGHHQTLQYAQNISEKSKAIQAAALTSGGIAAEGLYNKDILQLYLDARSSGLKIRSANATYEPSANGLYSNYTFNKAKGDIPQRWETEKDIFGSRPGEPTEDLIDNKARRYLQSFENLKTAADLRNLKLYDLYLLNAFDFDSGTISPKIEGNSEYFKLGNEVLSRIANKDSFAQNAQVSLYDLELTPPVSKEKLDKEKFATFVSDFLDKVLSQANKKNQDKTFHVSFDDLKQIFEKEFNIVASAKLDNNFTEDQAKSIYRAKVKRALAVFYKSNLSSFNSLIDELVQEFQPELKKLEAEQKQQNSNQQNQANNQPNNQEQLSKLALQTKLITYQSLVNNAENFKKLLTLLERHLDVKSLSVEQIFDQVKIETLDDLNKYGVQQLKSLLEKAKNKQAGFENVTQEQIESLEKNIELLSQQYKTLPSGTGKTKIPEGFFPQDWVLLQFKSIVDVLLLAINTEVSDLQAQIAQQNEQLKASKDQNTNKAAQDKLAQLNQKLESFLQKQKLFNEIKDNLFGDNSNLEELSKAPDSYILGSDINNLYNRSLVDGKGNIIKFDDKGQIIAGTYETYPSESDPKIMKFKNFKPTLFYKNGRPLIDINTFDDPTSYSELKKAIDKLTSSFNSKLIKKYENNGWDTSSSISTWNFKTSDGVANSKNPANASKYWTFLSQFLNGNLREFFYSYDDFKDTKEKNLTFSLDLSKLNNSTLDLTKEVQDVVESRIAGVRNSQNKTVKDEYIKLIYYYYYNLSGRINPKTNVEVNFDSFTKDYRTKLGNNSNYSYPQSDQIDFRNKDEKGKVFDLNAFKLKYGYYNDEAFNKLTPEQKNLIKQDSFYSDAKEKDLFANLSDLVSLRSSSFYKLMNLILFIARQQRSVIESKVIDNINSKLKGTQYGELNTSLSIYRNFLDLSSIFDIVADKVLDSVKIHNNATNKDLDKKDVEFFLNLLKEYFKYYSLGERRRQQLLSLTSASMPMAKVIKIGDNEYYQNPKYDYLVKLKSSNAKIILDATYTAPRTETSRTEISILKSSLWQLLNLDYDFLESQLKKKDTATGKQVTKDITTKFFGQKGEFAFKSKVENGKTVLDKSKIYLDNWDKEEFFDKNFFVKNKENEQQTVFTTLASFIDFISIDVYKFRIAQDDNQELYRTWDVDYALTKFDLYNYILEQEKKPLFNGDFTIKTKAELLAKLKLVLSDKTDEELEDMVQNTANELMDKFEKSSFNLLIKNNKFTNKNIDQLFLSNVGYSGFNTIDLSRGEALASNGIDTMYNVDPSILQLQEALASQSRIGIDYISQIDTTNSLNLDTASILKSNIEKDDASKSRINRLLSRYLKDKNIDISNARLFELQYLIGTKDLFTYSNLATKNQWYRELADSTRYFTTDLNFRSIDKFNSSRFENRVSDFFSDYVYNYAESLTRDLVQTTYLPSTTTLNNIPSYLNGFSEKNTGYEFFVDPSFSKKWLQSYTNPVSLSQGKGLGYDFTSNPSIANFYVHMFESDLNKQYADLAKIYRAAAQDKQVLIEAAISKRQSEQTQEQKNKLEAFKNAKWDNYEWLDDDKKAKILDIKKEIQKQTQETDEEISKIDAIASDQVNKYITPTVSALDSLWKTFYGPFAQDNAYSGVGPKVRLNRSTQQYVRLENYIGFTNYSNNGFFKDRFQRKVLDWQIYDENRESIKDDNISIKDLKGNKVTDRASAVWYYTLESQGIGRQTISSLWRDHLRDQIAFWGYNTLADNDKLEYLAFEDSTTGQRYFLKVQKENTNNIFYFKRQADESSKWTLKDEGYASWVTNWSILSTFSNALINPGVKGEKRLRIFFADKNKNELKGLLHLPADTTYLAENGKIYTQAPVYIEKTKDNQYFITIKSQFS